MVCRRDRLGHHSDVSSIVRMALGCFLERVVFLVCFRLGSRNIGEQLDESFGGLLQSSARPRAFLNPLIKPLYPPAVLAPHKCSTAPDRRVKQLLNPAMRPFPAVRRVLAHARVMLMNAVEKNVVILNTHY